MPEVVSLGQPDSPPDQPLGNPRNFLNKKTQLIIIIVVIFILLISIIGMSALQRSRGLNKQVDLIANQAGVLLKAGKYKDAAGKAAEGLKLQPNNKSLLLTELQALAAEGNRRGTGKIALDKAKDAIAEALRDYPHDPDILTAIGYAYEVGAQYDKALSMYQKALTVDPNNADTIFHIGHIYEFQGKRNEAFAQYDKAYQLDSKNPLVLLAKSREAAIQGNIDQAGAFYKQVSEMSTVQASFKAEAYTGQSILKDSKFDAKKALAYAKKAVAADPTYGPALAQYAYDLMINRQNNEALAWYDKAIAADPTIASTYLYKAIALRIKEDYDGAIASIQKGLSVLPADVTILDVGDKNRLKGTMLYELARTKAFIRGTTVDSTTALLKQAISLNPYVKIKLGRDVSDLSGFYQFRNNPQFQAFLGGL